MCHASQISKFKWDWICQSKSCPMAQGQPTDIYKTDKGSSQVLHESRGRWPILCKLPADHRSVHQQNSLDGKSSNRESHGSFTVNFVKSFLTPTKKLQWTGMTYDTKEIIVLWPCQQIKATESSQNCSNPVSFTMIRRKWEDLMCFSNYAADFVSLGRLYHYRLLLKGNLQLLLNLRNILILMPESLKLLLHSFQDDQCHEAQEGPPPTFNPCRRLQTLQTGGREFQSFRDHQKWWECHYLKTGSI